mgnify:CR=1 FL=1
MKPVLWLGAILIVFGGLSYFHYEPGTGATTYVKAEVISHTRLSSGKAGADPAFYVQLPSGLKVFVRDWGNFPTSYKGPVILQEQKGQVSGKPIYKINVQRTKELHNKAVNERLRLDS